MKIESKTVISPEKEILILDILDLTRGGAGLAKDAEGRVVFVPLTAPGDKVRVKIVETQKSYSQAELLEVLEPSPQRTQPRCSVFGQCGGCEWQHLPYALQWQTKAQGVLHALKRVSVDRPSDWREFPAEVVWNYRNRVQLRGTHGVNGAQVGFYARKSHQLIAIDRCEIAAEEINQKMPSVKHEAPKKDPSNRDSDVFKVEIVAAKDMGLRTAWNSSHSALGFRQVNDEQNKKLRDWVEQILSPCKELFDLFGGSGNLSEQLKSKADLIHCVDTSAPRISEHPASGQVRFYKMNVLHWLLKRADLAKSQSEKTSIQRAAILDPPREGLKDYFSEIAASLEVLEVSELVIVGCDADSWARDVSRFLRRGWSLKKGAVFDFFPQTHHVESAALLTRNADLS